ncbi:hypothetical protein HWV62_2510 [Athelia sp. TMB]|nr:hypothetical protein HWV62_2510 [Athelia sp. TMB]
MSLRAVGRPASASALTLPDYETSQALQNDDEVYKKPTKKRMDSRFWRSTLYALIIYIFLSLVIVTPILFTMRRKSHHQSSNPPQPWQQGYNMGTPSDPASLDDTKGAIPICNSWAHQDNSNGHHLASSYWSIPATGQFSIRSNASTDVVQRIWGDLQISMNSNKTSKQAYLSISMQASSSSVKYATNVCWAQTDDACDLALYVPDNLSNADSLYFNITLLFPHISSPSSVNKLATYLPTFRQSVGAMSENWTFSSVSMQGDSSVFKADYLQANNLIVQTSSAEISGKFYVTESLTLDTIDAPINAYVTLVNDWTNEEPTFLSMDTGQGPIDTKIHLVGPRPPNQRTIFQTSVKTFNAPLSVSVTHDANTPPSEFHLSAVNSVGRAYVTLDNKFQGTFDLSTKLASADINEVDPQSLIADPSGGKGKRNYQLDFSTNSRKFGWVGWGNQPKSMKHQGHVAVSSTHNPVILHLEGTGSIDADNS